MLSGTWNKGSGVSIPDSSSEARIKKKNIWEWKTITFMEKNNKNNNHKKKDKKHLHNCVYLNTLLGLNC